MDTALVEYNNAWVLFLWRGCQVERAPCLGLNFSTGAARWGCVLEPKDLISPNQHIVIH